MYTEPTNPALWPDFPHTCSKHAAAHLDKCQVWVHIQCNCQAGTFWCKLGCHCQAVAKLRRFLADSRVLEDTHMTHQPLAALANSYVNALLLLLVWLLLLVTRLVVRRRLLLIICIVNQSLLVSASFPRHMKEVVVIRPG